MLSSSSELDGGFLRVCRMCGVCFREGGADGGLGDGVTLLTGMREDARMPAIVASVSDVKAVFAERWARRGGGGTGFLRLGVSPGGVLCAEVGRTLRGRAAGRSEVATCERPLGGECSFEACPDEADTKVSRDDVDELLRGIGAGGCGLALCSVGGFGISCID